MPVFAENGGRIEIRGFGRFVVREYESYTGRNPILFQPVLPAIEMKFQKIEKLSNGYQ
jgi:hypothetical protein